MWVEVWQPMREFLGGPGKYAKADQTSVANSCLPFLFSTFRWFSDRECENVRAANFRELSWNGVGTFSLVASATQAQWWHIL